MAEGNTPEAKGDGSFSGGCLCGAVRYESSVAPQFIGQCHCVDCRKTSSTDRGIHLLIPEDALSMTGTLKFYDHPADSGSMISRGFCPECGAPICSRNSNMPGVIVMRASSLDDLEIAKPQMIVYASRAPSWARLDPDLPTYPEMPQSMERPATPG